MSLENHCRERLAAFRARLTDEPRYNPVALLSFELSRRSHHADLSARLIDPIVDTYTAILEAGTVLALDFGAPG